MNRFFASCIPVFLVLFFQKAAGQTIPGLDTTFAITSFSGPNSWDYYSDQLEQTISGKFLFSGEFSAYNGKVVNGLVRLNADLSVDSSFNLQNSLGKVHGFHQLPNGKILVYGVLFPGNNPDPVGLVRIFPNGSLDPDFHSDSLTFGVEGNKKIAVLPNGEILLSNNQYILKFQENGLPIPGFQPISADYYTYIQTLSPHTFLVQRPTEIQKYHISGIQDTSFHCGVQLGWSPFIYGNQSDSTFLITTGTKLFKINHLGTTVWSQTYPIGTKVLGVDPQKRILLYCYENDPGTSIFRIQANGMPDTSFTRKVSDLPSIVTLANHGFALFSASHWANHIPRGFISKLLDTNGTVVQTNETIGLNGPIQKLLIQKDKKVLACGFFTRFGGFKSPEILRFLPDGRLDSTFASGLSEKNYPGETEIQDLSQDSTGNTYGLISGKAFKLFGNGMVDTSFHFEFPELPVGFGDINLINLVVGPGQKLFSLAFRQGPSFYPLISRHFLDGRLDSGFQAPLYPFPITRLFQDSDSTLFIGNSFAGFADINQTTDPLIDYLVRIRPNGEVIPGFHFSGRGGEIKGMKSDAMGNVYVSMLQNYGTIEGLVLYAAFMKIKANGQEDSAFYHVFNAYPFGSYGIVPGFMPYAFEANSSHGMLSTVLGTDGQLAIKQICPDGQLHPTPPAPKLELGFVYSMAFADSQSVYVAGDFLMAHGQPVNRIARIKISPCVQTDVRPGVVHAKTEMALYPNPGNDYFKILSELEPIKVTAFNLNGKEIPLQKERSGHYQFKGTEWPAGIYVIRVETTSETRILKWWKD